MVFACTSNQVIGQTKDTFLQPVSYQYPLDQEMKGSTLKKVVVDYNNNVYVLSDKGVCRVSGHQLVKDLRYRPLADKIPVDLTIQEHTGYLYYLYPDCFLSNADAGIPYGKMPGNQFDHFAVNRAGHVLLTGNGKAAIFINGKLKKLSSPPGIVMRLEAVNGIFYLLTSHGIWKLLNDRFVKIHEGKNLTSFAFKGNEIWVGTPGGYYGIDAENGKEVLPLQTKIPIQQINRLINVQGQLWAATPQGAFMKKTADGFAYYASRRWLNNDEVKDLAADHNGNIFLLTPDGLNEIKFKEETYLGKAHYFQEKIRKRHIRYGLLAEVRMSVPGDLSTAEMIDTDNDGLWTSFYLGSQAFRYAVTGDSLAKRYVWESFAAYERLISINQLKGFPSRTFERTGYKVSDPKAWRLSPDSGWEWKGTTSSDEFVGYIFIAAVMDQYVGKTAAEKKRIAAFIDKILTHIIQNDYNFVDLDGKPTLWGRWNPDYINSYAKTISDRKLGSTDIIAGLQLGYALTGKAIYKKEALRLMNQHGYLENIMISPFDIKATPGYIYKGHDMGMGPWNHSDDEMEFLSYWVLYHYALNDTLKKQFAHAITEYWKIEKPEKNPVWNLITLGTAGSFDKESVLWYLREFPMDLIRWDIKNSQRKDLDFIEPGFRNQYTKEVISPAERPAHRYNANEFILDGGSGGKEELTGAEYLLPYWMARYLKVIKE